MALGASGKAEGLRTHPYGSLLSGVSPISCLLSAHDLVVSSVYYARNKARRSICKRRKEKSLKARGELAS